MESKELIDRNKETIDIYLKGLMTVDVNAYSKTTQEKEDFDKKTADDPQYKTVAGKQLLMLAGFKPFYEYGELLVNCINAMAKKEKVSSTFSFLAEDLSFREDEKQDHDKWVMRVSKSKNGEAWIGVYYMLLGLLKDTHEGRVNKLRVELPNV